MEKFHRILYGEVSQISIASAELLGSFNSYLYYLERHGMEEYARVTHVKSKNIKCHNSPPQSGRFPHRWLGDLVYLRNKKFHYI